MCVCECLLPEAARCIAEHLGGMEVDFAILVVIRGGVPVGLGYDDTVGQNGQGVLDDWHLQGIARRQVPQHTYAQTHRKNKQRSSIILF